MLLLLVSILLVDERVIYVFYFVGFFLVKWYLVRIFFMLCFGMFYNFYYFLFVLVKKGNII